METNKPNPASPQQDSSGKYSSVQYPTNITDAMSIATAGSQQYDCPDEVQNKRSMTSGSSDSSDRMGGKMGKGYQDSDGSNADQQ